MASQVALHRELSDPFLILNCAHEKVVPSHGILEGDLTDAFEKGRVIVFDNLQFHDLGYLMSQPGKWYADWVPPVFSRDIRKNAQPDHVLRDYYQSDEQIKNFQSHIHHFETAWLGLQKKLFPHYKWALNEFSYRFNHMSLGFLHLDVPDSAYEEHQFRWFINLDTKPRILTVGPTIFEMAYKYWDQMNLEELKNLPTHEFIGQLRKRILDETIFREREMPRHYLTLDPGSMWLAHSSYISHGLVYGRKTACLEGHIDPASLRHPERHFNSLLRGLQRQGKKTEQQIENSLAPQRSLLRRIFYGG